MNTRRRLFPLIAALALALIALAAFVPLPTDGRFVGVAYFDGEIKVRLATGKVWAVPVHEGCDLLIGAVADPAAMPTLRPLPDDSGTQTLASCQALYAPPPRGSVGTAGP